MVHNVIQENSLLTNDEQHRGNSFTYSVFKNVLILVKIVNSVMPTIYININLATSHLYDAIY